MEKIQRDGNGRPYIAAEDLDDETHARILLILDDELNAIPGGKVYAAGLIPLAARAAERVYARAVVTGTDREAAEIIRNTAEKIYADVLADR